MNASGFLLTKNIMSFIKNTLTEHGEEIVDDLVQKGTAIGIRNSDLSELTGWPRSRTSKIVNKTQKLSVDDFFRWLLALGLSPTSFLQKYDRTIAEFEIKPSTTINEFLQQLNEWDQLSPEQQCRLMDYEMPYILTNALNVNFVEYTIRTKHMYDPFQPTVFDAVDEYDPTKLLRYSLRHRNIFEGHKEIFELRCYFSPDRKYLAWGLFAYHNGEGGEPLDYEEYREKICTTNDEDGRLSANDYSLYSWLPAKARNHVVFVKCHEISQLLYDNDIEDEWRDMFQRYRDIVMHLFGIDIKPEPPFSFFGDMLGMLTGIDDFSQSVKKQVLDREGRVCEIDNLHQSFLMDSGDLYMEVKPLIPLNQTKYGEKVKTAVNGVCLCPVCAAKLQHGNKADREDMIYTLYRKHSDSFAKSGIVISISELMKIYGL